MMTFKTIVTKHRGVKIEDYINTPVVDKNTSSIDFSEGVIRHNEQSKIIGVITDVKDLGEMKVELTITLLKNNFQGEYLMESNGKVIPMSYSMGFE